MQRELCPEPEAELADLRERARCDEPARARALAGRPNSRTRLLLQPKWRAQGSEEASKDEMEHFEPPLQP